MAANLIDLRRSRDPAPDDLPGLQGYLAQLVGEPFRFARVSYGDELTLHFGDLRPARSPKLAGREYGNYILGVRGSGWAVKSGPNILSAGIVHGDGSDASGVPVPVKELGAALPIRPGSRVVRVTPFPIKPDSGYGLELTSSHGDTLLVLPTPPTTDDPEDESLPAIADWELLSPGGLLRAGPGPVWAFEPAAEIPGG